MVVVIQSYRSHSNQIVVSYRIESDLIWSNLNTSEIRWGEDKQTGDFKGYCHLEFKDSSKIEAAVALSGYSFRLSFSLSFLQFLSLSFSLSLSVGVCAFHGCSCVLSFMGPRSLACIHVASAFSMSVCLSVHPSVCVRVCVCFCICVFVCVWYPSNLLCLGRI